MASSNAASHSDAAHGGDAGHHAPRFRDFVRWARQVLGPDAVFVRLALLYGAAISLLSLATPISVQLLVNSVANTALPAPLLTLAALLFVLLLLSGMLSAFRVHLLARFERRFFARLVGEITLRAVHAQNPFFVDSRRGDLFNRFFDMGVVQKSLTSLLIAGFTIVLQSIVGLVVTSFYHPFFLAFNLVLVMLVLVIWRVWTNSSIASAVAKSHAKHATAHWLGTVGNSNGVYKSSRHMTYAIERSDEVTANYVAAHRRHFRYTFSQTVALLLLYAVASAGLLAMGGWLILQGELSIGQLVAAELILSGVFYGIAQLGTYLEIFYEMAGSLEELHLFWEVPQEAPVESETPSPPDGAIRLRDVRHAGHHFNFFVNAGDQVGVMAAPGVERVLAALLKRLDVPKSGFVSVGGADLGTFDMYRLRSDVIVLDRPTIVEMTVREYLGLSAPGRPEAMIEALSLVGLERRVGSLEGGLDAMLSGSGWPLSVGETMALKLAGAVLARPRVLMLSPLYDMIPPARLERVLAALREYGTTVLQFTERPEGMKRDLWLWIGKDTQIASTEMTEILPLANGGR
ncbi:MAG: ABC transporter ATP-binding protein [Novosphingobium sp. 28-62-57]|uniref:ABC transporter transmembrane domain-containing protein n=1 Tax=unclassified Novosphingobium TaxID=2644732 RepID=UPI000BD4CB8E|nr:MULTISPECIES: ABC transporter transmembrane domain-containing protein [unclassified Novosphingobium]OYW51242.1 MAG: ABC transporter ATP-binding protein [Novosphingobium sp. 12-62-10]OYZ10377.1 MAG: ABC transporter ATP-binding protein [Novosphingobium sp. 28-62-57]OZA38673.1 MAG: ABC transporter ATP-binding protein [Novosphingobium sp. 17-62-9]HQS68232.1 ABC transporter transmembrane domain-containing protein [Novosphingobium sp.]